MKTFSWHLAVLHAERWTDLHAFTLQAWLMMPSGIDTNLHQGPSKMPTFLLPILRAPVWLQPKARHTSCIE